MVIQLQKQIRKELPQKTYVDAATIEVESQLQHPLESVRKDCHHLVTPFQSINLASIPPETTVVAAGLGHSITETNKKRAATENRCRCSYSRS